MFNEAGGYLPNSFIIKINEDNQCFKMDRVEFSTEWLSDSATFFHEYFHYFLNLSTPCRIRDIQLDYQILANVSHLMENGTVRSELIKKFPSTVSEIKQLLKLREELNNCVYRGGEQFRIISVSLDKPEANHSYEKVRLEFEYFETDEFKTESIYLSDTVFEESICALIEKNLFCKSIDNLEHIPYHLLELLTQYYNLEIDADLLLKLAILSLFDRHPILFFVLKLNEISQEVNRPDLHKLTLKGVYYKIRNEIKTKFALAYSLYEKTLDELHSCYDQRGYSQLAMSYYLNIIKTLLKYRLKHITLDADILTQGNDTTRKLENIIKLVKPHWVILSGRFSKVPIMIYSENLNEQVEIGILVHFVEMQFVEQHFVNHQLLPTEKLINNFRCPLFEMCNLEFKLTNPNICRTRAWEVYKQSECYMHFAIMGLTGKYLL